MKNMLLAFESDWMVEPRTLQIAKDILPNIKAFFKGDGVEDYQSAWLKEYAAQPLAEVFTLPFLSEKYCEILLDEVKSMPFAPNPAEDELRQIPEIVLSEKLPEAYLALSKVVESVLNPILFDLWQRVANVIHIQVANYNPRDKKAGAWHHDRSADITVVVPLNTGDYSGGGTEFWGRGIIPPLPTGSALVFPSLTHLHRGLPVSEGDRYLLVFWLKVDHEQD